MSKTESRDKPTIALPLEAEIFADTLHRMRRKLVDVEGVSHIPPESGQSVPEEPSAPKENPKTH